MLQQIVVENIALIQRIKLEFDPGFNVMTGETGAGKSIIIDAVGLALGGRFSTEMIRTGADTALIEAIFDIKGLTELEAYLEERGVPLEVDHNLIIQREVSTTGRNRCRVNDYTVTVLTLSKIGEYLIDIHGQHEHQSLLFPEKQLNLLDEYCGKDCLVLRDKFNEVYKSYQQLTTQYQSLQAVETDLARKIELLQFQADEIDQAKLTVGEDEALLKEKELLNASEKLYEAAQLAYRALYDNGEGQSAVELLATAERSLTQVVPFDERLTPLAEAVQAAVCQAEDAARELRNYQDQVQFDPERLSLIEERLDEISRMKRKYGASIEEILAFQDKCSQELQDISNREARSAALEDEIGKLREELGKLGRNLSQLRRLGADRLERAIEVQLADLNMEKTKFAINLQQIEDATGIPWEGKQVAVTATGCDRVEFLVSPNPGEALKPLTKIASGGELSRMMLAMKAILAELDQKPTMIFDEIDVGIGGRTAQAVAEKILFIGQARQVICITHLPQIASMAKRHFLVEKEVKNDRTMVSIHDLMMDERINELARMLGGAEVTETTRQHAREMLTMAESLELRLVGRLDQSFKR